jgi:hypothetical protein
MVVMRKIVLNSTLMVLSIAISLLVCEFVVRIVAPQRLHNTPAMFVSDDDLIFKLKPHFTGTYSSSEFVTPITTNSIGLRDKEIGPRRPGDLRIVGLGDSFSFANGVTNDETYFKVLERSLQSALGRPVDVINCAVPAYSPLQEARMLEKYAIGFDPDIVLMGFFVGNDFVESMDLFDEQGNPLLVAREDGFLVTRKERDEEMERSTFRRLTAPVRAFLTSSSHLYVFLKDRLSDILAQLRLRPYNLPPEFCAKEFSPKMEQAWSSTQTILRDLANYVRKHNKRLIIVVLPTIYQVYKHSWDDYIAGLNLDAGLYDLEKPQAIIAQFCREEGIEMVDVLPVLRTNSAQAQLFFPVDGHPTKEGHRIIGEVISDYLVQREQKGLHIPK